MKTNDDHEEPDSPELIARVSKFNQDLVCQLHESATFQTQAGRSSLVLSTTESGGTKRKTVLQNNGSRQSRAAMQRTSLMVLGHASRPSTCLQQYEHSRHGDGLCGSFMGAGAQAGSPVAKSRPLGAKYLAGSGRPSHNRARVTVQHSLNSSVCDRLQTQMLPSRQPAKPLASRTKMASPHSPREEDSANTMVPNDYVEQYCHTQEQARVNGSLLDFSRSKMTSIGESIGSESRTSKFLRYRAARAEKRCQSTLEQPDTKRTNYSLASPAQKSLERQKLEQLFAGAAPTPQVNQQRQEEHLRVSGSLMQAQQKGRSYLTNLKHSILDKQSQLDHMKQFKLKKNKQRTLYRSIQIDEAFKCKDIIDGGHQNLEISARESMENEQVEANTVASKAAANQAIPLAGADARPKAAKSIELKLQLEMRKFRSELRHLPQYRRFSKIENVNAMFKNFNADELQNALGYRKRARGCQRSKDIQPKAAASSAGTS